MNTIAITGGTGLVGTRLTKALIDSGHQVIIFSRRVKERSGNIRYAQWDPENKKIDAEALSTVDAVVHLAGAGVADKRWTDKRKKEIMSSRKNATNFLVEQLKIHAQKCTTFIAASATGYYGPDRGGLPFRETDDPYNDFLARVCVEWEKASLNAEPSYRTVIFRFGIVLGKEGGAYPQLSGPMNFGVMPILGNGNQMVSWIHEADLTTLLMEALAKQDFVGIYNAVSPAPVTHKQMMRAIAAAKEGVKIPVPVPPFALKLIMGEASVEVLKSCTASAQKLINKEFAFRYATINEAALELTSK